MPLKVLYVLPPTKSFAGIERVVDEVCEQMAATLKARLTVDVLFTAKYPGHPIENRRYNKIQRETATRTQLVLTLREVAGSNAYDLVVIPQVEATVLGWFACLGRRRPFVLYLHGNPKLEMRSWKARILFFLMEKIVLSQLSGVFGVSKTQLQSFRTLYPSKIPHFWTPNPVRRFSGGTAGTGIDQTEPVRPVTFVNVGRFSYQKGQDILLRAFATVRRARPDTRLVLVGYGPDREALVRLIETLGVKDAVSIAHLPDDPGTALAASDVYVSASRWEGWSLAICEALRFGLPVIATNCEFGPSDILTDRRLGVLVPSDDADRIAEAMIGFHDNLAQEKAHQAFRMDYVDAFSVEKVVHDHAFALEQVRSASPPFEVRTGSASTRTS